MKLKCRIHEEDYDIVTGAVFSEEYNETLDSGSIILDHIAKIRDLKPYDDVFIWDADYEFEGYQNIGDWINLNEYENASIDLNWVIHTVDNTASDVFGNIELIEKDGLYTIRDNPTASKRGCPFDIWCYLVAKLGLSSNSREILQDANMLVFDINLYFPDIDTTSTIMYRLPINPLEQYIYMDEQGTGRFYTLRQLLARGVLPLDSLSGTLTNPIFVNFQISEGFYNSYNGTVTHSSLTFSPSAIMIDVNDYWQNPTINSISINTTDPTYASTMKYQIRTWQSFVPYFTFENLNFEQVLSMKHMQLQGIFEGKTVNVSFEYIEDETSSNDTYQTATLHFSCLMPCTVEGQTNKITFSISMKYENEQWSYLSWSGFSYDTDWGINVSPSVEYYLFFTYMTLSTSDYVFLSVYEETELPPFFKHMLVGDRDWEMVDLRPFDVVNTSIDYYNVYKCKIDLVSETKGLETVHLPNISITQPIVGQKRTILYYLKLYLDLYSPKIKRIRNRATNEWEYVNKYKIDERTIGNDDEYLGTPVSEIFNEHVFAPEMSLTNPNLRDIISRLMIVKDCIPVVKNNVIYAMDISKTHGEYIGNSSHISFVHDTLGIQEYSTAYRREYQGAISQRNSTHYSEYLGFRDSSNALLTLTNLYIETKIPIYKINTLYMCYYKRIQVHDIINNTNYYKIVLVKQDISKLVLENTVRNTLPADWTKYSSQVSSIEQMAGYKILTIGYDVGSNKITGWGEQYKYINDLLGWTNVTNSYIETMMDFVDEFFPYGMNLQQFLNPNETLVLGQDNSWRNTIYSPSTSLVQGSSIATKLKTIFFQIDYIGMYDGALIHSKDNTDENDIVATDNCSSALSILEVDGLFEKEKANRIGNPVVNWSGRYDDYAQMNDTYNNKLGSTFDKYELDTVIYHREYAIYEDCVICNFVAAKDYVLKNYFTSVFAKYRTYSYASYNQSVNRAENDYYSVMISDNYLVYEEQDTTLPSLDTVLSAFAETQITDDLNFSTANQINCALIAFASEGDKGVIGKSYFTDVNTFVSGYSLGFNMKMYDALTAGIYISTINCFDDSQHTNYVGSAQDWYVMPVNSSSDGYLESCGFWFGHLNEEEVMPYSQLETDVGSADALYEPILKLPLNPYNSNNFNFTFGKNYKIAKDNKEVIDFTLQYELINYENDNVLFSEWLMKLSDYNQYIKTTEVKSIIDNSKNAAIAFQVMYSSIWTGWDVWTGWTDIDPTYDQLIVLRIDDGFVSSLSIGDEFIGAVNTTRYKADSNVFEFHTFFKLKKIIDIDVLGNLLIETEITTNTIFHGGQTAYVENKLFFFQKMSTVGLVGHTDYYFRLSQSDPEYYHFLDNGKHADVSSANWNATLSINNTEPIYVGLTGADPITIDFPQTMFVLTSTSPLEQSLVYEQYQIDSLPSNYTLHRNINLLDVFKLTTDANGRPCIEFNALPELGNDYESVQYWYLDDASRGGDGYLHFVFGVNAKQDMKIYISVVKNRRKKVYDYMHRVVGTVLNCAETENEDKFNGQFYEEVQS